MSFAPTSSRRRSVVTSRPSCFWWSRSSLPPTAWQSACSIRTEDAQLVLKSRDVEVLVVGVVVGRHLVGDLRRSVRVDHLATIRAPFTPSARGPFAGTMFLPRSTMRFRMASPILDARWQADLVLAAAL